LDLKVGPINFPKKAPKFEAFFNPINLNIIKRDPIKTNSIKVFNYFHYSLILSLKIFFDFQYEF